MNGEVDERAKKQSTQIWTEVREFPGSGGGDRGHETRLQLPQWVDITGSTGGGGRQGGAVFIGSYFLW